jgi:hypothetical protein
VLLSTNITTPLDIHHLHFGKLLYDNSGATTQGGQDVRWKDLQMAQTVCSVTPVSMLVLRQAWSNWHPTLRVRAHLLQKLHIALCCLLQQVQR